MEINGHRLERPLGQGGLGRYFPQGRPQGFSCRLHEGRMKSAAYL